MTHTHLTDDQLIARCVTGPPADAGTECAECASRHADIRQLLDEIAGEAGAAADAAFPLDRLARQHARIMQRLEQHGRLGRVLAFPLAQPPRTSILRPRPMRRWIAAAAAAGLLIGMVAGHLVHELPFGRRPLLPAREAVILVRQPVLPLQASSTAVSDDEFLREIEMAVGSSGPAALHRIDVVTPVAWEVR